MPPLISVVTVNLNDAHGLAATGQSVVAQTEPLEWLVVDGGSSDGSLDVIQSYAGAIATWSSAPDRGVYDAMNQGLRRARGAYIVFMNAGDRFVDRAALARLVPLLARQPDLLFTATLLELPSGHQIHRPPRPLARLRFGLPAYHQATLFRREAHLAVPYDLRLRVSADYGAVAALARRGARALLSAEPLAVRRCDPDSLSERATGSRFRDFVRVQRDVLGRGAVPVALSAARLAVVHLVYRRVRRQPGLAARLSRSCVATISKRNIFFNQ